MNAILEMEHTGRPAHLPSPVLSQPTLSSSESALAQLGKDLKKRSYRFTTITPASHARVNARPAPASLTLCDIFGWSRAFAAEHIPPDQLAWLAAAGALQSAGPLFKSAVRYSTLGVQLFAHSGFPTQQGDAVFFGPDTYRFVRFADKALRRFKHPPEGLRMLDVGAGSGAAGLHLAMANPEASVTLSDINSTALAFCRINAAINRVRNVAVIESDLFANVEGEFDIIVANPPYLVDPLARLYRHGGGKLGYDLSLRIAEESLPRLSRGGRLVLYTGSAIVDGADILREELFARVAARGVRLVYEEIDPDVFGEELEHAPYDSVDRIAAVGITIDRV